MHTPQEPTRIGDHIQQAQQIANAAANSESGSLRAFTLSFFDVDLPCILSDGAVYVQAPLERFHDALSAAVVDFLRDLEIRISEARRAALASADTFPEFYFETMASEDVVRRSGEQ